jgi:hypothetical protein
VIQALDNFRRDAIARAERAGLTTAQATRFVSKIQQAPHGDCWLWTAGKYKRGYGMFNAGRDKNGKQDTCYAHRLSYALANGLVTKGTYVLHHCDTPACVNPSHLFLGTQADNMRDMREKGRAYYPGQPRKISLDLLHQAVAASSSRGAMRRLAEQNGINPRSLYVAVYRHKHAAASPRKVA